MIITIDGHAGSGKSTAARMLAAQLGYELMNTGAMYRATALALGRLGIDIYAEPRDEKAIAAAVAGYTFEMTDVRVKLNGRDLTDFVYTEEMGRAASRVGTFPEVRARLKSEQRRLANGRDIICEGRDQGTAVFPDAPIKFFFTASPETRARRRAQQDGIDPDQCAETFAGLVRQIAARDRQDEHRPIDPLRKAPDAVVIDTSDLSQNEVLSRMVEVVDRWRSLN
ncbi:MAG TPA: (d)CMP kinase [Fimbriiglobus sp.]|jgi:cytidylate kinase|nr:(d)CMP kinase [Fimbriiglobus sp.]